MHLYLQYNTNFFCCFLKTHIGICTCMWAYIYMHSHTGWEQKLPDCPSGGRRICSFALSRMQPVREWGRALWTDEGSCADTDLGGSDLKAHLCHHSRVVFLESMGVNIVLWGPGASQGTRASQPHLSMGQSGAGSGAFLFHLSCERERLSLAEKHEENILNDNYSLHLVELFPFLFF